MHQKDIQENDPFGQDDEADEAEADEAEADEAEADEAEADEKSFLKALLAERALKKAIRMDDLVKKERKIVQNLATSWLFLRKILATLARI